MFCKHLLKQNLLVTHTVKEVMFLVLVSKYKYVVCWEFEVWNEIESFQ